ncbi:MAG: hypothetical protein KA191_08540 [Verrucomicrobia bacterium]|nr:hypothetical protein [Verrucomicrobiota bacterium]OQC66846.1 MAG: hypothetical protein BWX48_01249 [Verrucomicrobia bacterium ADurb.Bin006]MDI9380061.1 hypothetical protein [Verrucomicrobiota bacterium]NMD19026.1 hypothetical protein [Verrucomicrobiota bacterium]HNU99003.1 hypothetical protein [Verrucomicrobiota bacterium]
MPCLAASWESLLVFAVIVLLSGLSNWLKQRQARREEEQSRQSRPIARGRDAVPPLLHPLQAPEDTDWERELRRLFGEEPESPPPRPLPAPPPIEPQPPPLHPRPDTVVLPPRREPSLEPVFEPAASARGADEVAAPAVEDLIREGGVIHLPSSQATAALRGVSSILGKTVARTRAESPIEAQVARPMQSRQRVLSPEIARVRAQLRQPRTAREVFLATVLLGPPRGLEDHTWPVSSTPATFGR